MFARIHLSVLIAETLSIVSVIDLYGGAKTVLIDTETVARRPADLLEQLMSEIRRRNRIDQFI